MLRPHQMHRRVIDVDGPIQMKVIFASKWNCLQLVRKIETKERKELVDTISSIEPS